MRSEDRDRRVLELYHRVLEIEERLIPTGLHVFGRPDAEHALVDMLRMVASFERPEANVRALTDLVAEGLGYSNYSTLLKTAAADESGLRKREEVDALVRRAVELFLQKGVYEGARLLETIARVPVEESLPAFRLLESISIQLKSNQEMESLLRALRGAYIEPGPDCEHLILQD